MKKQFTINWYFDKRFKDRKDDLFPLRLSVYDKNTQRRKYYSTDFAFTEKDWKQIENFVEKTGGKTSHAEQMRIDKYKPLKQKIDAYINKAKDSAEKLKFFTFPQFEKELSEISVLSDEKSLKHFYDAEIEKFRKNGQIGTMLNYDSSFKSINDYYQSISKKRKTTAGTETAELTIFEITPKFLEDYEAYMLEKGKSLTTVGIYLRPLRNIINTAISNNLFDEKYYPFHKPTNRNGYKIPAPNAVKKALNSEQLKILLNAVPENENQQKAKDFWVLSYAHGGINIKDFCVLKYSNFNLEENSFVFIREKTKRTNKNNSGRVVKIAPQTYEIVHKYRNADVSPSNFVFPILNRKMSAEMQKSRINAFVRFLNTHIKKLAENNGLPGEISTYWARHSFANRSMNMGDNESYISMMLGHSNLKTSRRYLGSFEDKTIEEKTNKLFDFE